MAIIAPEQWRISLTVNDETGRYKSAVRIAYDSVTENAFACVRRVKGKRLSLRMLMVTGRSDRSA